MIEELKAYMIDKKLTQEQLAAKLGLSFTTISRWLNGKFTPSKMAQDKIAWLLKKK